MVGRWPWGDGLQIFTSLTGSSLVVLLHIYSLVLGRMNITAGIPAINSYNNF